MSLTSAQRKAIKSEDAARVLVEVLNDRVAQQQGEIEGLRLNYADIQNQYEKMQRKFYKADTLSKVLASKSDSLLVIEFIKVIISGVALGWGFLLVGQGDAVWGIWLIVLAVLSYSIALTLQKQLATKQAGKRLRVRLPRKRS